MTIGGRICKYRERRNLTQKRLGELAGIAEPTIRRYELGLLNPKLETLTKIATALEVPVSFLLTDDTNETALSMGATVIDMDSPEKIRSREYYYKLWNCLKRALSDDKLACHCNNIVVHLGKSVESGFTYYDQRHDAWCDYFLSMGGETHD